MFYQGRDRQVSEYEGGAQAGSGIDWEGTLFTPQTSLLTYLSTALRNYPAYRTTGDATAHQAMIRAGCAPGSEFLWNRAAQRLPPKRAAASLRFAARTVTPFG